MRNGIAIAIVVSLCASACGGSSGSASGPPLQAPAADIAGTWAAKISNPVVTHGSCPTSGDTGSIVIAQTHGSNLFTATAPIFNATATASGTISGTDIAFNPIGPVSYAGCTQFIVSSLSLTLDPSRMTVSGTSTWSCTSPVDCGGTSTVSGCLPVAPATSCSP